MKIFYTLSLILLLSSAGFSVLADNRKETEIQHLLVFIENSNCVFIRNNNEYPPVEAKSHIEKKYNYYKSKISSTEDFIKLSATKSSLSGRNYTVRCNNEIKTSSQWLREELSTFRKQL